MGANDAQQDYDKAEGFVKPSVLSFRMKPDWESATTLYEKAATSFKLSKDYGRARMAFERAATGHQRQGSPWHSGKALEKAADMAKEVPRAGADVEALYRDAARAYLEAGRMQAAAEALARAAQHLEGLDPTASSQLYLDAVDALEEDGKESMAADLYRQAVGGQIRMGRYADAVGLLLRFAVACHSVGLGVSQAKCYLGAVVVWLFAQDAAQAWAVYQDALEVGEFSVGDYAAAADALLQAYRSGDAEEVKRCVASRAAFLELDNQVVRLAKRLPQGDVAAMARDLSETDIVMGAAVGEGEEEDLT